MKRQDFISLVQKLSDMSYSRAEGSTRPLAVSLVPKGGRGPYAPEIEPRHAAAMLCAYASPMMSATGNVAERMLKLRPVAQGKHYPYATFHDMLADNLGDLKTNLHRLEMSPHGNYALASFKDKENDRIETVLFTNDETASERVSDDGHHARDVFSNHLGNLFVVNCGALERIAAEFNKDRGGGWKNERTE